jgi:predicted DNA-binding transcriptional regulator YafY
LCVSAQDQLQKSREIIKRLQEEKKTLQQEMQEKLQSSERSIEEDKEEMIQELRRGRTAALQLMQVRDFPPVNISIKVNFHPCSIKTMYKRLLKPANICL